MTTAILILTIFNTGLIIIIGLGGIGFIKDVILAATEHVKIHVDKDTEDLGTAIFNMDSLKAKASSSGKAEL